MVDLTSISALLAAIGVLVGVVFATLQLRTLARDRKTALLIGLFSTISSREWLEAWEKFRDRETLDYDKYREKYGMVELNQVSMFFLELGALLHRKLIDIELIGGLFRPHVKMVWEKVKPSVEDSRRRAKDPTFWIELEYLYNEMQKREQALQQTPQ
ncbi:MAG: hypothetical protein ACFE7R_06820 [Candidatus Hodarchaeota archaeon]